MRKLSLLTYGACCLAWGGMGCNPSNSTEGSSRGVTQSLGLPDSLDLVQLNSDDVPPGLTSRTINIDAPESSPKLYFDHDITRPIQTVETILCFLKHLKYQDNMNCAAAYGVRLDISLCESNASQGGDSNAQQESHWRDITVLSCRENLDAPHRVQVSFESPDGDTNTRLFAEAAIYESPATDDGSLTGDFGKFTVTWQQPAGSGALWTLGGDSDALDPSAAAQKGWSFYESGTREGQTQTSSAILRIDDDGNRFANIFQSMPDYNNQNDGNNIERNYNFKASGDVFHITEGSTSECFDKSEFGEDIWSYELIRQVDNTWEPVILNASVQFEATASCTRGTSPRTVHGNLSRWGIYVEDDCTIENNTTVQEVTYGDSGRENGRSLTYVKKAGRLEQQSERPVGLEDLGSRIFLTYTWGHHTIVRDGGNTTLSETPSEQNLILQVMYNANDNAFQAFSVVENSMGAHQDNSWEELTTPFTLFEKTNEENPTGQMLWMQSPATYNAVIYRGGDFIYEYFVETIPPGSAFLDTLDTDGIITLTDDGRGMMNGGPQTYYFRLSDHMLYGETNNAIDTNKPMTWAENVEESYDRNLRIKNASGDNAKIFFNWYDGAGYNQNQELISVPWENFQGLKEGNTFIVLEEPLHFQYTHSTENDRAGNSAFDGETYILQYAGRGQLWGIPGEQDEDGRWYPWFSLANGVELTVDDVTYVVRALQGSRRMTEQDEDVCSSIPAGPDGLEAPASKPRINGSPLAPSNYTEDNVEDWVTPEILVDWSDPLTALSE